MKILVTGATGQVGYELRRTLATLGDVIVVDEHTMDLADAGCAIEDARDQAAVRGQCRRLHRG